MAKGKIILLIFLSSATFFLVECKKERVHYTIPQELKDMALFQKNSYWIFKNENSNTVDSCFVDHDPDAYTLGINESDGPLRDIILVDVENSFINRYSMDFSEIMISNGACSGIIYYVNTKIGGTYISWEKTKFENLAYYDSIFINNIKIYSVHHTRYSFRSVYSDSAVYDYYVAKNIGIVKYQQHLNGTDTIYSIIRWHTIQ